MYACKADFGIQTLFNPTMLSECPLVLQSMARAQRPSTKRQSAPARADSPSESPYASILGIDVADESYSPTVRMPITTACRSPLRDSGWTHCMLAG
jgi:hypothetical protein